MELVEEFDFEGPEAERRRESEETLVGAPVGPSQELLAKARAFQRGKD